MRSKVFSQLDARWGKLPYPSKPYTISSSGCGCCSVTHVIIERDKYKNYTPKNVQPYMKQYAVRGQGTTWRGIYQSLKYYGMANVKWFGTNDPMSLIWKELNKKNRIGVILFGSSKGPDGTVWTTDGHYIAFTDYKVSGGRHWFYLKDSGPRRHSGWYCYERSMKGDVRQVYTCTVSAEKTAKKTTATPKASANGKKIAKMATKLAYGSKTALGKYPNGKPDPDYKSALNKVYPNRDNWGKAPKKGASCDVFVGTTVRAAGIDSKFPRGLASQVKYLEKSKKFERVKNPTVKNVVDGDIIQYAKDGGGHTCIVVGGKIKEASYQHWYGITTNSLKSRLSTSGKRWLRVYRAK